MSATLSAEGKTMPNGDTKVPLREHVDIRVNSLEKLLEAQFAAIEKATALYQRTLDVRLEGLNEWRQQSKDREREFLPREEYRVSHDRVVEDVRSLRESRAEISGKASQKSVNITQGIALAALAGTLINVALRLAGR